MLPSTYKIELFTGTCRRRTHSTKIHIQVLRTGIPISPLYVSSKKICEKIFTKWQMLQWVYLENVRMTKILNSLNWSSYNTSICWLFSVSHHNEELCERKIHCINQRTVVAIQTSVIPLFHPQSLLASQFYFSAQEKGDLWHISQR